MENTLAHLIVEQGGSPEIVSAHLFSTLRQNRQRSTLDQQAVSLAHITSRHNILHAAHLFDVCLVRRCRVQLGSLIVLAQHLEDPPSSASKSSIAITIEEDNAWKATCQSFQHKCRH